MLLLRLLVIRTALLSRPSPPRSEERENADTSMVLDSGFANAASCVTVPHVHHGVRDCDAAQALLAERMLGSGPGGKGISPADSALAGDCEKDLAREQRDC